MAASEFKATNELCLSEINLLVLINDFIYESHSDVHAAGRSRSSKEVGFKEFKISLHH